MQMPAWENISREFHRLSDLDALLRTEELDQLSNNDPALAREVGALFRALDEAPEFMEASPAVRTLLQSWETLPKRPPEFSSGQRLGGFQIIRKLGAGSFADVYLARDLDLMRLVALKVSSMASREAQSLAMMEQENIVAVFSELADESLGVRAVAMAYVEGQSLRSEMSEKKKLPRARIVEIGLQLAKALSHAHRVGILHLDIKPENILLNVVGKPFLVDFNVSVQSDKKDQKLQISGGTIGYMSPEQTLALANTGSTEDVGVHSDVFSLAVVLYEMLMGRIPLMQIFKSQEDEPDSLLRILRRGIAADRTQRYNTAEEFAGALQSWHDRENIAANMPESGPIGRIAAWSPWASMFLFNAGPQLIGSVFNIFYVELMIVRQLSPYQYQTFLKLLPPLNSIIYAICIAVTIGYIIPIAKFAFGAKQRTIESEATMRRRCLRLPLVARWIISFGWAAGLVSFPLGIHMLSEPVSAEVYGHFAVAFLLSWLVTMTYSVLFVQFVVVRVLYPNMLLEVRDVYATTTRELRAVPQRLQRLQILAGVIPLVALMLMFGANDDVKIAGIAFQYKMLVFGLLLSGTFGIIVALRSSAVMNQVIQALTKPAPSR